MDKSMIFNDGTEVPRGWCVLPDHYQTTFAVVFNGPRVHQRIESQFKIIKSEGHEITIQSLHPNIVDKMLSLISQKDAKAIKQVTIVKKHDNARI